MVVDLVKLRREALEAARCYSGGASLMVGVIPVYEVALLAEVVRADEAIAALRALVKKRGHDTDACAWMRAVPASADESGADIDDDDAEARLCDCGYSAARVVLAAHDAKETP